MLPYIITCGVFIYFILVPLIITLFQLNSFVVCLVLFSLVNIQARSLLEQFNFYLRIYFFILKKLSALKRARQAVWPTQFWAPLYIYFLHVPSFDETKGLRVKETNKGCQRFKYSHSSSFVGLFFSFQVFHVCPA